MPESEHDNQSIFKVSLTRGAVERLISDNPEVKVQLTNQVIDAIAKKCVLKSVENSPELHKLNGEIRSEVTRLVDERMAQFAKRDSYMRWELNPNYKRQLSESVHAAVDASVNEAVAAAVAKNRETLAAAVQRFTSTSADDSLRAVVAKLVREELGRCLNSLAIR